MLNRLLDPLWGPPYRFALLLVLGSIGTVALLLTG